MAEHFLTKTQIDLRQCLEVGGGLALESYPALHQLLLDRAGPEAAKLFAEPLVSRGNDKAQPSVSWYSDVSGNSQPFGRLDENAQAALSSELSRQLRPVRDLLDDPDDGPLVAAALHVVDLNDVWSVGGAPVIINWGILPADLGRDSGSRKTHYAQTLGRFLPLGAAPPLTDTERSARQTQQPASDRTAQAAVAGGAAGVATAATLSAAQADTVEPAAVTPPPPIERRRTPLWAWLPLLLLLLLAGGALAWLLIPGNRIFPDLANDEVITDEAALEAAENVNRALEARLAELQSALDGAMCEADGTLLMPDGRTIEGLLPPDPLDRADIPGATRPAAPQSILPPDPERVQIPNSNGQLETASLLTHIEERTAIVLATSPQGLATGTGFFVGPDLLVTNFHVIAGSGVTGIFVTNEALGTVRSAELLKSMGPFENTGGDFALLRVEGAQQPAFSVLEASDSLRLQSVIAAGYPGDILAGDAQYDQLKAGDRTAFPELSVTDGTISAEQVLNDRSRVVVHSAPISTGNSGGPLIDMCGRLIGVNTFVRKGSLRNLNFALASSDLMTFLANTDALPEVVTQTCAPQIQRPQPPATAALEDGAADPAPGALPALPPLTPQSE